MSRAVLAIHGAFRGAWMWEPMIEPLADLGHRLVAMTLSGMGAESKQLEPTLSLGTWVEQVAAEVERTGESDIVIMGHSMGGLVAQEYGARAGIAGKEPPALVLLDSPICHGGLSGVELSMATPVDASTMPPRQTAIAATPVSSAQGYADEASVRWVNQRLCSTPLAPQLDPTTVWEAHEHDTTSRHIVFFDRTPEGYPARLARSRCDETGVGYSTLDEHHDAPILSPTVVARHVARLLEA